MKKVLSLLFAAVILSTLFMTAFSAVGSAGDLYNDQANVLSVSEAGEMEVKLKELGNKYNMDFAIVVIPSLNGKSDVVYADDYYDYNGYKDDGSVLLISVYDHKGYISTKGYAITAFTDYGINYITSQIKGDIKDGDYYEAFEKYIKLCDNFVAEAKNGKPYDTNHKVKSMADILKGTGISLGIGLVIAILAALGIKKKYKPVMLKAEANDYLVSDSLVVHNSYDNFLYTHVTRERRSDDDKGGGSSTHTSSSGSTHGGGGFSW